MSSMSTQLANSDVTDPPALAPADPASRYGGRLRRVPAYRELAEAITRQILDGQLSAGEQLPTEARLCELFGVNRSTVREAIRVLEEANLLRREHAKKMVISRPTQAEVADQLERALLLHEVRFDELLQAMYVFEPSLARLASQRRDARLLERLDRNLLATREALASSADVVALDIEFHGLVAQLSANRPLIIGREPLSRLFFPAFKAVMVLPAAGKRLLAAHQAIRDAIVAGDEQLAHDWMRRHIGDFERGVRLVERSARR